uniref:Protease n=1 Tax=Pipistrellus pipistrellus adenovirus TaxID=3140007 RepID=A0AAU6S535_9ADEN
MGSTEEELRAICRDLGVGPNFLGTFDKRFPGFVSKHKRSCAIVNTAGRETGGVHWLAFAWEPTSRKMFLFDPFGFSDQKLVQFYQFEYQGLLKRSAIASTPDRCVELVKNTEAVQGPNSAACGLFCCMFLQAFTKWPQRPMEKNPTMDLIQGVPNARLFDTTSEGIFAKNQRAVYAFLSAHSPYFRNHRASIERNTAFNKALENGNVRQ